VHKCTYIVKFRAFFTIYQSIYCTNSRGTSSSSYRPPFHTTYCSYHILFCSYHILEYSYHSLFTSFPEHALFIPKPYLLLSTTYPAHTAASSPLHTMYCSYHSLFTSYPHHAIISEPPILDWSKIQLCLICKLTFYQYLKSDIWILMRCLG
jgi:hypothetical protein